MKNTQYAEAVVSARRRRQAVAKTPKIIFEIRILGAHTSRPAEALRPSLGQRRVGFGRAWEAALTLGVGGPADVVEKNATRFRA